MANFLAAKRYPVPAHLATEFTPSEVADFRKQFSMFDANGDAEIDTKELAKVLASLGDVVTADRLSALIGEVDSDHSGTVSFGEFCQMMHNVRHGAAESSFGKVVRKAGHLLQVQGAGGAQHSFSEEEKAAFSEHINNCLRVDPHVSGRLPINPQSLDLFTACNDGLIFCKLINLVEPDTVDERALNTKANMSMYLKVENQNLAINAAKAIGCVVTNIGAKDLIEGRPILVLGLLWQIIKMQLLAKISLKNHPELVRLLLPGEDLEALLKLHPEEILLRWFNFHLQEAGSSRRVGNFGKDLEDAEAYSILLHQLSPSLCPLATDSDRVKKAGAVIKNAKALGISTFIQPTDITSGNKKLNLGFVAQIFNTCPGLTMPEDFDFAGLELDDAGDTREERVFRLWINSLGLPEVYINNLFADLSDGLILLKIMNHIQPGIVDWKKVNIDTRSRFKKVENCNYVVLLGRQLNLVLVNVGGLDIVDKNKKLILAIVWQLMRRYILDLLKKLASNGHEVTEEAIVAWANSTVSAAGKASSFHSFKDHSVADGRFLIDLTAAIEPRAVNWDLVTAGETEADKLSNAKYCISIARKLGACVFLTPEDIVEVKSKMLMTFVASLWSASLEVRHA